MVASLSCIIRVVRVKISLMIRMQYMSAIAQVGRDHLGWLDSGIVPQIELPEASHAVFSTHYNSHSTSGMLCLS